VSGYPAVAAAAAAVLDVAVRYFSGTISNRSAVVPSPVAGDHYYGTDTGLLYEWNGSAWLTVMLAGAWQASTAGSGVITAPYVRTEGDVVRFRGSLAASGTVTAGATLCTLPSGCYRTDASVQIGLLFNGAGVVGPLAVDTSGHVTCTANVTGGNFVTGLTFTLT
jgi:hypothetical protein